MDDITYPVHCCVKFMKHFTSTVSLIEMDPCFIHSYESVLNFIYAYHAQNIIMYDIEHMVLREVFVVFR